MPKVHIHFLDDTPTGLKQVCVLQEDVQPGETVTVHLHQELEMPCFECKNGHCHAPNVTLSFLETGEIMLQFESISAPVKADVKKLALHDYSEVTH